jgi:hydroxybutyrate-dimer hydrolase
MSFGLPSLNSRKKFMNANRLFAVAAPRTLVLAVAATALLGGCGKNPELEQNFRPNIGLGLQNRVNYDGVNDDLLTAGLGKTGLQSASAPAQVDPTQPTPAEIRRLAIYNNYRALVDTTAGGGFGTLYGPNVDAAGVAGTGEGKIAGSEYLAYSDDGSGLANVTMMVQIPTSFNRDAPCIVAAASSGSRGVYGAIGTAGEWGLKRGCAVAYTDKGTGNGVHDLASDTVSVLNGQRATAAAAGALANFNANIAPADLTAFNTASPNRVAVKHAHSQRNPERDWGNHTLAAIEYAFFVINEQIGEKSPGGFTVAVVRPENTIVIASSVSNGAGAALAAAEADSRGLIDGVAVAEPNIQIPVNANLTVRRGTTTTTAKQLYDYFTYANLLQPCAALAASVAGAPAAAFVNTANATNRCAALKGNGILNATTTAAQAEEALAALVAYGWQPESSVLHASHYAFATPAIAVTYGNAHGRFGVRDNLCNFSFAATDATGAVASAALRLPLIFATGNGIPPTSGINIINNASVGGPLLDGVSISASTNARDFNFDGAKCLRELFTATTGDNAAKVKTGMAEVLRTGNLRGKPAIIVHGRADALVPVSFSSRPYFGTNKIVEGANSKLTYIEVTNAQHFDAFNGSIAGFDTRYVPLHRYFNQAMDLMFANLRSNAALPPSQVVRTTPRGGSAGAAPAISAANVPPISATPAAADQITFSNNVVTIPD